MKRKDSLQAIKESPEVSVLIIGGGVNGIGVFRDLAANGVDALLVDRGDFGSGTSAGSSHMLHGGIRYLENGEFRLVNEALRERGLMLANAPHYAKPLRTTIPIFSWCSGLLNAPLKFLNLLDQPGERGALVIKLGLTLYDLLARGQYSLPRHEFRLRRAALKANPQLHPDVVCAASYYDAWMPTPERICLEMLLDAEASHAHCRALNYVSAIAGAGEAVTLRDELDGAEYLVKPKVVINAAGPWIDFVNAGLGESRQRFIGGTKGSHLVLDNPELLLAVGESEIFFENDDGRIVLILPYFQRVMIGTTDIHIEDPDEAVISDAEIEYLLGMVNRVFPNIAVARSQIVFSFSAVRPLPYDSGGKAGNTGQISRDHSIRSLPADCERAYPIHSLIGGKWTTFRAFSEQAADQALRDLGRGRVASTASLSIGGGRDYPASQAERDDWLQELQTRCELPMPRLRQLFERYGTRAASIAKFISRETDSPLVHAEGYSRREIAFLLGCEKVERLDDVLLRRTLIAMLGGTTRELLHELAEICGNSLGWSAERQASEIRRALDILRKRHRVEL